MIRSSEKRFTHTRGDRHAFLARYIQQYALAVSYTSITSETNEISEVCACCCQCYACLRPICSGCRSSRTSRGRAGWSHRRKKVTSPTRVLILFFFFYGKKGCGRPFFFTFTFPSPSSSSSSTLESKFMHSRKNEIVIYFHR